MKYNELGLKLEDNAVDGIDYSYQRRKDSYDVLLKNDKISVLFFEHTLEFTRGTQYDITDLKNMIEVLSTPRKER